MVRRREIHLIQIDRGRLFSYTKKVMDARGKMRRVVFPAEYKEKRRRRSV